MIKKDYGAGIKAGALMGLIIALVLIGMLVPMMLSASEEQFTKILNETLSKNSYSQEATNIMSGFTPASIAGLMSTVFLVVFVVSGLIYGILFTALINIIPGKNTFIKSIIFMSIIILLMNIISLFTFGPFIFLIGMIPKLLEGVLYGLLFGYLYARFAKTNESMKNILK